MMRRRGDTTKYYSFLVTLFQAGALFMFTHTASRDSLRSNVQSRWISLSRESHRWGAGDRGVHWTRGDVRYSGRGTGVSTTPSTHSSYSRTPALSLSPEVNTSSGRLSAYHSSLPGVESPRIGLNTIDGAGLPHLDGVSLADLRRCVPYVSICPLRRRSSTTPPPCRDRRGDARDEAGLTLFLRLL